MSSMSSIRLASSVMMTYPHFDAVNRELWFKLRNYTSVFSVQSSGIRVQLGTTYLLYCHLDFLPLSCFFFCDRLKLSATDTLQLLHVTSLVCECAADVSSSRTSARGGTVDDRQTTCIRYM